MASEEEPMTATKVHASMEAWRKTRGAAFNAKCDEILAPVIDPLIEQALVVMATIPHDDRTDPA